MPEISIIVPVYKVENYLSRCIDSILAQTFEDFELILVDDGSPDKCGEICDTYADKDARIKVIHKKNGGLSDARNAGLDIAVGNYIGFVDSDDYIENDMYELLINNIIRFDADISTCGVYQYYPKKKIKVNKRNHCDAYRVEDAIEIIMAGKIHSVTAWNKLYKRNIFDNIRYPVGFTTEDAFIILDILGKVSKVVIDTTQKYYYVHRAESITTRAFSGRDYDVIHAYTKNLNIIKKQYPSLTAVAYYRFWWSHFYLLNRIAMDSISNRKKNAKTIHFIKQIVRRNVFKIIRNPYQSLGKRIAFVLIFLSPNLYMRIYHFWFYRTRALN